MRQLRNVRSAPEGRGSGTALGYRDTETSGDVRENALVVLARLLREAEEEEERERDLEGWANKLRQEHEVRCYNQLIDRVISNGDA